MRVLYIDHTAALGGGEIALVNLIRNIDPSRVEPVVLLFSDGPLVQRLSPFIQPHVLALPSAVGQAKRGGLGWSSLLRFKEAWYTARHIFKVAAFARSIKADLVHTNSLKADIIGGLAGRLAGIPVIWHVRDRIHEDYLPPVVVHVFRFLCRIIPTYVIANSDATLSTLNLNDKRQVAGTDLNRVAHEGNCVVHDGCEVKQSLSLEAVPGKVCRVGLVGRISPWKGQDVFLRAAAKVLEQHPDARFEIIGSVLFAETDFEESLHRLCRSLGIERSVDFVGFVEDVPARIAMLDILVHASTTAEPFGQVIIEAMAESKPVVATNGGGVPEIVHDGVTGLLVPMGDPGRLADALEWLLAHPAEAASMGRAGYRRVSENFTIQKTARAIESIYAQILSAGRAANDSRAATRERVSAE